MTNISDIANLAYEKANSAYDFADFDHTIIIFNSSMILRIAEEALVTANLALSIASNVTTGSVNIMNIDGGIF